jgi:hypothetical protein
MADRVFELFDEFAVRHVRGEYPDPVEYLDRAGKHGDELADMLEQFLQWAPPPAPEPAAVTLMEAWLAGEPPLLALRVERGLRVDDVVAELAERLQVAVSDRSRLRRYLQRLEGGLLDASRVNQRVFAALASFLGAPRSLLVTWASPPRDAVSRAATAPAYRGAAATGAAPAAPPAAADGEWDDLDELFLGAREA